jgi:hypothetical protein
MAMESSGWALVRWAGEASLSYDLKLRMAPITRSKGAARKALWEAYSTFVAAFREAAEKLKAGDRNVVFPIGSFPPRLPFVAV